MSVKYEGFSEDFPEKGSSEEESLEEGEEFSELIKYTIPGYILGLLAGVFLDFQGYQRSPVGQWLVRTLAGVFEGLREVWQKLMAGESYSGFPFPGL
jgi:hypothetical protein